MEKITEFLNHHPVLSQVLSLFLTIIAALIVALILLKLSRKLFRRIRAANAKNNNINLRVFENILRFLIVFVAVLWVVMSSELTRSFGQTLFTGTAVLAAIAGFAAQPVLSDLICGFIIGSTRPFEIGNRITLDSGLSGIVQDITLRHVVLKGIDTQVYVIPNSKMNGYVIQNMSYQSDTRSVDFRFTVSFNTDPEEAARVIEEAIQESPYSVPGKKGKDGEMIYARVYFMAFLDSALQFATTAYYEPGTPTEVFKDDINTRVKKALDAHGLEIPYAYTNVVMKE
ncbi:MAG: mechanosensitive ion channel family protein [Lachnospiraceae bacterium]|nr:mechanosensitive ion channel family protein [Lachnospiraceae bacterium]